MKNNIGSLAGLVVWYAVLKGCSGFAAAVGEQQQQQRRTNRGLVGYGIDMYQPHCAFACQHVLDASRLACSTTTRSHERRHGSGKAEFDTSPTCRASDEPYLLSLALCLDERCDHNQPWGIDQFWAQNAVNSPDNLVSPTFSYREALARLLDADKTNVPPVTPNGSLLDAVSRVQDANFDVAYTSYRDDAFVEMRHSSAAITLICAVVFLPLALQLLRFLPFPKAWERRVVASLGHAALWGGQHAVPLPYSIGILPTRGQAVFIAYLVALNIVLMTTGYRVSVPNLHDASKLQRWMTYFANRVGILSAANMSLMILCSSRNNVFVYLTKWSYSTVLLYHRWIAYLCISQALLHALIHTLQHFSVLLRKYTEQYWLWGNAAVLAMCMIVPLSVLPVRKRYYELFVDSHVSLALVTVIGSLYHILTHFGWEWGYENWILLILVLWVADRTLRMVKILGNGMKTAHVTYIDADYARVDVPGVKAAGHAYLYFPTLTWRIWQNHPFSIAGSVLEHRLPESPADHTKVAASPYADGHSEADDSAAEYESGTHFAMRPIVRNGKPEHDESELDLAGSLEEDTAKLLPNSDEDVNEAAPADDLSSTHATGITFYVRRQQGMTARLFASQQTALRVLVEGPYRPLPIPSISMTPNMVCIAGGVGISPVLPALRSHALVGRSALYWSSRSEALVQAVDLQALRQAGVAVAVQVRRRWDVARLVGTEARECLGCGDLIVMVSGPNAMADEVRAAVVRANLAAAGARGRVRLVEECFSW